MKLSRKFIPVLSLTFLIICLFACSQHERQVVPIDMDADEVFQRLTPNEEDAPEGLTFGDNIPGVIFDYEMETNDSDIYVFFDKLTLLDIKPEINLDIMLFVDSIMAENDFLPENYSLQAETIFKSGKNYSEEVIEILDSLKYGFEKNLGLRDYIRPPFHLYFLIYPIYLDENCITYRLYASSYTGGAHGMQYSYLRSYNLENGQVLTLTDVVKAEDLNRVREEVVAQMAYSYPIYENITTVSQYLDSLNKWLDHFDPADSSEQLTLENYPLSSPAITTQGLAFTYEMYELTPGSDGCPLVVIPYHDIKGCLYSQFDK